MSVDPLPELESPVEIVREQIDDNQDDNKPYPSSSTSATSHSYLQSSNEKIVNVVRMLLVG